MVLGIDPDTKQLAFALWDGGRLKAVGTIHRSDARGRIHERYDSGLTALVRRCSELGASIVVEGIYLGKNVKGFAALAMVAGELHRVARLHSVPVVTVGATQWQSSILGITKGRDALKAASAAHAQALWPERPLSEHESDAVCLAEYGFRQEAEVLAEV